jgi:murein DD-endopeptidase MepM/ murein hydrolase activator NlpD
VFAARTGTVVFAGADMLDYGNAVILDHGNGLTTLYGHNEELLVRTGERVTRGQTIARAGKSGNASTVHVHFEVRRYAEALDPMRFLGSAGR